MSGVGRSFNPIHEGHMSIVDSFFPGFSHMSLAIKKHTGIDMDAVIPLLCLYGLAAFVYQYGLRHVWRMVECHFTSVVHIPYHDEVHGMFLTWISAQSFAKDTRSSLVTVDMKRAHAPNPGGKKPLGFAPWNGEIWFWYKTYPLRFRRVEKKGDLFARAPEELSIQSFGSSKILKELLEESRQTYLENLRGKTLIFEALHGEWKRPKTRRNRQISTVLQDEQVKKALLDDTTGFLSPNMRNWYNERGLPYRRGYLLYGPPGTGKSSFSFSIAGHLDLDVYIVSLASVNDVTLGELFAKLPEHCVVLLEDIDVATRNRAQAKDAEDAEDAKSMSSLSSKEEKSVTLSGLLNVLDGVGSQEGRVLIMTTNYIERLDAALIRPGRVDIKVEFRLADNSMAKELYRLIFREPVEKDNEAVEQRADEFAGRMPEGEFSPAEVLSLLLEHRQNPEAVVANVEAWVARTREEKTRVRGGGNVVALDGQD